MKWSYSLIKLVRSRPLLGTFVEISVYVSDQQSIDLMHIAISKAYQVMQRVDSLMSFHNQSSELSRLNKAAYLTEVQTHPWLYAILQRAQKVNSYSEGIFDCTVAPILINYGFLPKHCFYQASLNDCVSQQDLMLLPENKVKFKQPLCLDLGGIAKGFAVDLAVHQLREYGIKNAVVNAGGDLRVIGEIAEEIYIRDPIQPQQLKLLGRLSQGAVATSGSYFSQKDHNQQQKISHLIHPITKQSIVSKQSFTVFASQAWLADALTKVLVCSQNIKHPCFKRFGAQALII